MKDQSPLEEQPSDGVVNIQKSKYWVWIVFALIALILIVSWVNRAGELVEIQYGRFENMVPQGAIKQIVLVENEKIIEITLRQEALQNAVYNQELERSNSPFGISPSGPHYKMKIISIDKFYRDYDELTRSMPREQKVDVQVEERSDIVSMLINWAFLLLLVSGFVFLIRRLTPRVRTIGAQNPHPKTSTTRYRYPALRTIASIYMASAWIVGVTTAIVVGVVIFNFPAWIPLSVFVVGFFFALGLAAFSEGIRVFLDIEYNTRMGSNSKKEDE